MSELLSDSTCAHILHSLVNQLLNFIFRDCMTYNFIIIFFVLAIHDEIRNEDSEESDNDSHGGESPIHIMTKHFDFSGVDFNVSIDSLNFIV